MRLAVDASALRFVGNLCSRNGRLAARRRQREKSGLAILLKHNLASTDLAQNPSMVIVAQSQSDDLVCGLVKEDAERLLLAGHRSNKREQGTFRFGRLRYGSWHDLRRCDDGRWRRTTRGREDRTL